MTICTATLDRFASSDDASAISAVVVVDEDDTDGSGRFPMDMICVVTMIGNTMTGSCGC